MDNVLKVTNSLHPMRSNLYPFQGTYLTLVRSSKSTSAYTLPAINLMKNSASEIFSLDHTASYQLAFGYIRQLAIHLRNSMKIKTKVGLNIIARGTRSQHKYPSIGSLQTGLQLAVCAFNRFLVPRACASL